MPINYEAAKREMPVLKAKLTRAKKQGPQAVLDAVREAYTAFDRWGAWPDNWHLWQRARDDAIFQAHREGIAVNAEGTE